MVGFESVGQGSSDSEQVEPCDQRGESIQGLVWFGEGKKFPVMQSMCLVGIVWNLDLDDGAIGGAHKVSFTKYMEMFYQTYRNVFMNFFSLRNQTGPNHAILGRRGWQQDKAPAQTEADLGVRSDRRSPSAR